VAEEPLRLFHPPSPGDTFIGMYSVLAVEASSRSEEFDIASAVRGQYCCVVQNGGQEGCAGFDTVEGRVGLQDPDR
jgi:hypothetical protein